MVAPITGPYSRITDMKSIPRVYGDPAYGQWAQEQSLYVKRKWYRQAKPRRQPLPYDFVMQQALSDNAPQLLRHDSAGYLYPTRADAFAHTYYAGRLNTEPPWDNVGGIDTLNRCHKKLADMLGDGALLATNMLEWKQSFTMIEKRAIQIARFTRKLNRFDFPGAAKELGLTRVPKGLRASSKSFGNNWLEYHLGWEPLVKDIGGAINTVCSPLPSQWLKAKATKNKVVFEETLGVDKKVRHMGIFGNVMGCEVYISNPNTFLLSQLGFINPASVIWEAVKLSFVADWFGNVGQVLGSWSTFAGLTVSNEYTTYFRNFSHETKEWGTSWQTGWNRALLDVITAQHVKVERKMGLATPILHFALPERLSPSRGATAIGLLLQVLPKR